ncbi:MAG TPA: DUF58 domain-containing protein [Kofleriaceae bacterium]|nr:DUF58 domain-containing protein [Kofleriaceae bacterium]
MAVRRRARFFLSVVPEPRLAAALAVAALLWLLPGAVGVVAGFAALALIALATAFDYVRLPTAASFSVARELPVSLGLGDAASGEYIISNPGPVALQVTLADRFPPALTGGAGSLRLHVNRRAVTHHEVPVRGIARAEVAYGAFGARVTTALGLLGVRFRYDPGETVRVIPSMKGVRRFRLLAMQHHLDRVGVRSLRRRGEGQGFAGLREYVLGDDPRHIDWKSTAKRGKPITREFTIERSQTVLTLIDAGRNMTQLAGEWSRFEQALSSALVLTDIAATSGDRVGTMVFDDQVRAYVPPRASRGALQAVRDALVPVTASSAEPDYANAFRFLASRQRKRALIVFFTDVLGVRASRALLAHVSRSSARHLALVVALRNDDIFAAAQDGTTTTDGLYSRAAAEELIQEREEALEHMRRAGAIVLDVSPQVMTAGVINRYLELKARGAL